MCCVCVWVDASSGSGKFPCEEGEREQHVRSPPHDCSSKRGDHRTAAFLLLLLATLLNILHAQGQTQKQVSRRPPLLVMRYGPAANYSSTAICLSRLTPASPVLLHIHLGNRPLPVAIGCTPDAYSLCINKTTDIKTWIRITRRARDITPCASSFTPLYSPLWITHRTDDAALHNTGHYRRPRHNMHHLRCRHGA